MAAEAAQRPSGLGAPTGLIVRIGNPAARRPVGAPSGLIVRIGNPAAQQPSGQIVRISNPGACADIDGFSSPPDRAEQQPRC